VVHKIALLLSLILGFMVSVAAAQQPPPPLSTSSPQPSPSAAAPQQHLSPSNATAPPASQQAMSWDAIAALGQLAAAAAAAIDAWFAYRAVQMTKLVAAAAIRAELQKDYASPEMYKAIRCFGEFAHNKQHKERLKRMRDYYFTKRALKIGPDTETKGDFDWAYLQLENDTELSAARRQIHHYFKRIWALHRVQAFSDEHLLVLTDAQYGYVLWRDDVLPTTFALALAQSAEGNPLLETEPL